MRSSTTAKGFTINKMGRPPACSSDKLINVKKGSWTDEEDSKFLAHVSKHGIGNWNSVPKKAGLGKSCKPRWSNNYLRPNLNQETFTSQEEELIVRLHATIGSRWSIIAQQLPGRTDNDVKNYWNTKLKKKLREMGIDPVTHRPFSQILADYGNIGGMPRSGIRIGIGPSLNKDLKNAMLMKPEPYTQGLSNMSSSHFVPTTKMEPTQANNSGSTTKFNYYQPYDLLTQLQAMKYVTDVSNSTIINTNPPAPSPLNFYNEGALSSSSSSTCSSAASAQEKSAQLAFGWSDFLLDDAFVPTDDATRGGQGQGTLADILPNNFMNQAQTTTPENQIWEQATMQQGLAEFSSNCTSNQAQPATLGMNYAMSSNQVEATTSCDSSFVEAMVAKDNDMFLEFPELLLEEPFYF